MMPRMLYHRLAPLIAILVLGPLTFAAPSTQSTSGPSSRPGADGDKLVVTHHEIQLPSGALKYEATAGTLALKDEAGKPRANFFFVAYRKETDADFDPAKRPITFVFNGGPGAAAVWLHLGAVGPRTVKVDDEGIPTGPPHTLIDNQNTWLDATDLVLIDPVNTGYSRAAEGVKPEEFFGVDNDLRSVGEFIRTYLTRYDRWLSPKFLTGESYGTTRAAGLSQSLLGLGIDLNGIVFVSSVLDFATISAGGGNNDMPYALFLPSYTAVAMYHKKLDAELSKDREKTLAEVQAWALGDYTAALAKGDSLSDDERAAVAKRLSRYTSLPQDTIDRARLRIDPGFFEKKLLSDQRRIIGRYDGRLSAVDVSPNGTYPEFDPSYAAYLAAYTSNMTAYARKVLKFESDMPYESLSGRVQPWSMGREGRGFLDVATSLSSAMRQNPRMRVLFVSGYDDLATPYFATDYTLSHMELGSDLHKNVSRKIYEGGHMMYHVHDSQAKLHSDATAFIRAAVGS
jgi:carboxypeptidase C (cathepsin A)